MRERLSESWREYDGKIWKFEKLFEKDKKDEILE